MIFETIDTFHKRIYVNYLNGKIFVYRSEKDKLETFKKLPFEIWNFEMMKNYENALRTNAKQTSY